MDNDVLRNKITSLIRCIERIQEKTPETVEILSENFDIQDIIALNLERAVQLSVDIGLHIIADYKTTPPERMSEVFIKLCELNILPEETAENLSKAVGFRNIAVHQYQSIDWAIVFSILKRNIDDFTVFIERVFSLITA
jgi:uncharacterized protein YutE (UPF0331/DUF86 family)